MNVKTKIKRSILLLSAISMSVMMFCGCSVFRITPKFVEGTYYGSADISRLTVKEAIPIVNLEIQKVLSVTDINVKLAKPDSAVSNVMITSKDLTYYSETENFLNNAVQSDKAERYTPQYNVEIENIKSKLSEVAGDFNTVPVDAKTLGFDLQTKKLNIEHASNGYKLNVEKTAKVVAKAVEEGKSVAVNAQIDIIEPKIKDEDVDLNYTLLSTYSTISTNSANGNHNMKLALNEINGTELKPGETFSYNDTLGDSTTAASGFLPAHVIVNGVLVQGYGGGICQPSSTLYITALKSGMEIVERYCHSMPSSYVPIGLDATVSYGSFDMKFKNVLEYPVYIFGSMSGTTVTTSIYGVQSDEWEEIKLSSWCSETIPKPSKPVYWVDKNLEKNQVVLVTNGNQGYKAGATRTFYKNSQEVKTENLSSSRYYEKAATYKVGAGTDTSNIIDGEYKYNVETERKISSTISS